MSPPEGREESVWDSIILGTARALMPTLSEAVRTASETGFAMRSETGWRHHQNQTYSAELRNQLLRELDVINQRMRHVRESLLAQILIDRRSDIQDDLMHLDRSGQIPGHPVPGRRPPSLEEIQERTRCLQARRERYFRIFSDPSIRAHAAHASDEEYDEARRQLERLDLEIRRVQPPTGRPGSPYYPDFQSSQHQYRVDSSRVAYGQTRLPTPTRPHRQETQSEMAIQMKSKTPPVIFERGSIERGSIEGAWRVELVPHEPSPEASPTDLVTIKFKEPGEGDDENRMSWRICRRYLHRFETGDLIDRHILRTIAETCCDRKASKKTIAGVETAIQAMIFPESRILIPFTCQHGHTTSIKKKETTHGAFAVRCPVVSCDGVLVYLPEPTVSPNVSPTPADPATDQPLYA